MAKAPTITEETLEAQAEELVTPTPGWHVTRSDSGLLLGVYPTEADANEYADCHPRSAGIDCDVTFVEG